MTITELFTTANRELLRVISQIRPEQLSLDMPEISVRNPATLETAIRYTTFDDAWVPDTLAGKTIEEIGTAYDVLRTPDAGDVLQNYRRYNERANEAVGAFPPALPVSPDADPQTRLLAMVGRS